MIEPRQDNRMQELIDWSAIMPMPRYAGGHDEQMQGLFKGATVLGHWNEGDYQGTVATAVQLADGRVAVYQDSYGSCAGCDAWEDANDDRVRTLCRNLANGAYLFPTAGDAVVWLESASDADTWNEKWKRPLAAEIRKNQQL